MAKNCAFGSSVFHYEVHLSIPAYDSRKMFVLYSGGACFEFWLEYQLFCSFHVFLSLSI
jgi:hypothetical protein